VFTALVMLNRFDEERMELVRKHIRIIFLVPMKIAANYVETGRGCMLNLEKFPECPVGTLPIAIAGKLVYFATLAKFKRGFLTSEAIKDICKKEQQRIVDKLSKELCE
jgi:hypothetical protein